MDKLIQGVENFVNQNYKEHEALFSELAQGQAPHTLFIACSDSRLVANLITTALPGDLFMVRNVANIVPPYEMAEEHHSTVSAIEYALKVLEVEKIVICGHSNCGGCNALKKSEEELQGIPYTHEWLELARPALKDLPNDDPETIEKANIVLQRAHMLTYPEVVERVEKGTLKVYGWYYNIGESTVENYDPETGEFVKVV